MYSKFQSEIAVRPDDIDMNNHVHYSKYLDYLLAARFDQMEKDYKVPIEDFIKLGYTWVASKAEIEFKRALLLKDIAVVQTQIESYSGAQVFVNFWILKKGTMKIAAEGKVIYTMVSITSGRPVRIPEDIIKKYSV